MGLYFGGNPARKIGKYRSYIVAACFRALRTAMVCDAGRMWNTFDKPSSYASRSAMKRSTRSAFLRPWTAMIASMVTRHKTSSALGAGNSSWSGENSGIPQSKHGLAELGNHTAVRFPRLTVPHHMVAGGAL